ncbi:hypothetical protein CPC16_008280 [Podila verticillata]|nr:hypothetical protein CPC16_008280 [Podila verticillata]KAI9235091.1 MAG: hypothetical protein BYD32DRAFT_421963 [Podila humilis]
METETTSTTAPRRPHEYWCHQCAVEITPMMVPHPLCPICHSEFVELIEVDNDPRAFMGGEHDHDHEHEHEHEHGHDHDSEGSEQITLEDLFRLFQVIGNPRVLQRQQQQEQRQQPQLHLPGEFPTGGSPIAFNSGLFSTQPQPTSQTHEDESQDPPDAPAEGLTQRNDALSPFLAGLLDHLGFELHYSADPANGPPAMGGLGGLGGLFNMVGNPGDYVFGQGGLDDVITHLMELQNRQSGPVGASDEAIESIPHHTLTDEELAASTECSVCKDEFVKEDTCLQLPCKHIFHDECIKPWLKTSATCPTCRFSLLSENDPPSQEESSQSS